MSIDRAIEATARQEERCPSGRRAPEVIKYEAVHVRLKRIRGKAAEKVCPCGAPAAEWAYRHDDPCPNELVSPRGWKYSMDLSRYTALCRECHKALDAPTPERCYRNHDPAGGNYYIRDGRRKCYSCERIQQKVKRERHPMTPEQRAHKSELQRRRRAAARAAA